ncbi:flavodoxin family protein [Cellulosilyticum ruminicola]|uniref:flavodoxin family protein n=1 Tax=Cellulosilyticum ruminicola TaxID=425254 RepID=UPI0006D144BF|nr:flavodoxin family protein [Cellulosilyticum ruminicola]
MKVLLINGSPHKNGCTFTALSEVAKTLNENSIETEIFHIGVKPIGGCVACAGCSGKGQCVFNDGVVNELIAKAKEADGFVVGSPVYYASPNGSLLSVLDRAFYAGKNNFVHKPAAAIASARRAGTTATLEVINKYFTLAQMPLVSSSYWNMVHGGKPEDVMQDLEGLQTMRNLGRNMAWLLKCIEAGKQNGIELPQNEFNNKTNFIR